jgi:hypothetical protein
MNDNLSKIGEWDFYKDIPMMRVNDDANGNRRYMVDHKQFMPMGQKINYRTYETVFGDTFINELAASIHHAKEYGGKPIASAAFGSGIVFVASHPNIVYQYINEFNKNQKRKKLINAVFG